MPREVSPNRWRRHHGGLLKPEDADLDRARRRRHRHSWDEERRHQSAERGNRSENESRRRHDEDIDWEPRRAISSRRPLVMENDERHRRRSFNDTDEFENGHHQERRQNRRHEYAEHRLHREPDFVKPKEQEDDHVRSRTLGYGEHRFDTNYYPGLPAPPRGIHSRKPGAPPRPPSPPSRKLRDAVERPSIQQRYGEHRHDIPVRRPEFSPARVGPPHINEPRKDGPRQRHDEHNVRINPRNSSHEERNDTPADDYSSEGDYVSSSEDEDEDEDDRDAIQSSDNDESGKDSHGVVKHPDLGSLPIRHRLDKGLAPASLDNDLNHAPPQHLDQPAQHLSHGNAINPEGRHTSAPSVAGPPMAQVPDMQLPHVPASQYPPAFTRSLSNIITPSESRSEVGSNLERPRSASASLSPTLAGPQSLSMSDSGVLGPKSYRYAPLKDLEFRLIRVLRARMSKLKCEIIHSSIDDAPGYTAISYAWGDGIDTKTLLLQGVNVPVAVSLHDALRAVRRREEDIFVWVDALCIDQQNKEEKNRQIRLMGQIYSHATSVAIWIGPEFENSELAVPLLQKVQDNIVDVQYMKAFHKNPDSLALFNLFKRDYWKRLWVVQEVTLAKTKWVYCGDSVFSWEVYRRVAEIFWDKESDPHIRQGPASFPELESLWQLGDESMLEVMRACRKKLSENARDKVFGVLGLLPEETRRGFSCDYSQSIKTVYMDVVDFLVSATHQLDVIRESIHFPLHVNSMGLPSWCPDWSHIPEVSGLTRTLNFAASRGANGPTTAKYRFHDEGRKLEISAITLDSVMATGVAVGTFCAAQDYLMAFLQWRAVLLHELKIEDGNESHPMHTAFCRTLCLGQIPEERSQPQVWRDLCYHVFASLIRERMPRLPIDEDLRHYADATGLIEPDARRKFLQDNFGNRMMGRSLCITDDGLIGLGSGYMTAGDVVVVPFGCSTPIILRPENRLGEYRYVGDIYIDGYMHGEAVAEMEAGNPKRVVSKYKLC